MKPIKFNPEGKTLFEAYGFENHEEVFEAFIEKQANTLRKIAEDPSPDINEIELAKIMLSTYTDEEILMMATKQIISEFEKFVEAAFTVVTSKTKLNT